MIVTYRVHASTLQPNENWTERNMEYSLFYTNFKGCVIKHIIRSIHNLASIFKYIFDVLQKNCSVLIETIDQILIEIFPNIKFLAFSF